MMLEVGAPPVQAEDRQQRRQAQVEGDGKQTARPRWSFGRRGFHGLLPFKEPVRTLVNGHYPIMVLTEAQRVSARRTVFSRTSTSACSSGFLRPASRSRRSCSTTASKRLS